MIDSAERADLSIIRCCLILKQTESLKKSQRRTLTVRNAVICTVALVAALFVWTGVSVAGPNIKEGLWEITSKMEMEGMPFAMPATSHKKCLTNDNLVP
jgi:hypothetical protein